MKNPPDRLTDFSAAPVFPSSDLPPTSRIVEVLGCCFACTAVVAVSETKAERSATFSCTPRRSSPPRLTAWACLCSPSGSSPGRCDSPAEVRASASTCGRLGTRPFGFASGADWALITYKYRETAVRCQSSSNANHGYTADSLLHAKSMCMHDCWMSVSICVHCAAADCAHPYASLVKHSFCKSVKSDDHDSRALA